MQPTNWVARCGLLNHKSMQVAAVKGVLLNILQMSRFQPLRTGILWMV